MAKKQSDQLISIVIPTYNEVENIQPIYDAATPVLQSLPYMYEIIFVDDGSQDGTMDKINQLVAQDQHVKLVELARNFGKEVALTAGLDAAFGDAVIMMDADLQHPPELIPDFIAKWEAGADVVIGVRNGYKTSAFKKLASNSYYKVVNGMFDTNLIPHATDFRLLDKTVCRYFSEFTEHNRMTRGLIDWLGFNRDVIHFDAPARRYGQASYTIKKLIGLTTDSFISHSMFPLRLAGYLGAFIMLVSIPLGLFIGFDRYILNNRFGFSGTVIVAVLNLFLSGITLFCLGLISLYIAAIHRESTNRPLYVVRKIRRIGRQVPKVEDHLIRTEETNRRQPRPAGRPSKVSA